MCSEISLHSNCFIFKLQNQLQWAFFACNTFIIQIENILPKNTNSNTYEYDIS